MGKRDRKISSGSVNRDTISIWETVPWELRAQGSGYVIEDNSGFQVARIPIHNLEIAQILHHAPRVSSRTSALKATAQRAADYLQQGYDEGELDGEANRIARALNNLLRDFEKDLIGPLYHHKGKRKNE